MNNLEVMKTLDANGAIVTAGTADPETCEHLWVPNSGDGGEPIFRGNPCGAGPETMRVRCAKCNARTWFTENQWNFIPLAGDDEISIHASGGSE